MNNKERRLFESTITRMMLVFILFVVPFNILSLVFAYSTFEKDRQQVRDEIKNTLEASVAAVETPVIRAYRKELNLSFSDSSFAIMESSLTGKSESIIASATAGVKDKVKEIYQDYELIDMVYFYFPENGYLLAEGTLPVDRTQYREFIYRMDESYTKSYGVDWDVYSIGGETLLMSFSKWHGADFGLFIDLNKLLNNMSLPESNNERWVFMANMDGTLCSDEGNKLLEQSGLDYNGLLQSSEYEVYEVPVENLNIKLVQVIKRNTFWNNISPSTKALATCAVVFTLIGIPLILHCINNIVILPLNRLTKAIKEIDAGNLNYRIEEGKQGLEFEQINKSFNNMMEQVQSLKIESYENELEKKNIMMRYLSQQIQPHFILNAMNILYSYAPEEYNLSQKMILCISKYFRYIVNANERFVTLQMEMEHIKNYFAIQRARFPELFYSIVEYEDELKDALIPPLLVQNFAENSIKHSLKIGKRITIFVITEIVNDKGTRYMRIRLADTGDGMDEEILKEIEDFKETGKAQKHLGVGIQNSIERLKYVYGDLARLHFWNEHTGNRHGLNIEMILPIVKLKDVEHEDINC